MPQEDSKQMKAKKWLTIITMIVSVLSLVVAFVIGKCSNCIYYDISMALLGSAVLGFIMSLTEYYVEKRKAMEEFWVQAIKILRKLREIEHLDLDAPLGLIIEAFREERSNELFHNLAISPDDKEIKHEAKNNLISWYEKNASLSFDNNTDVDKELEEFYKSKLDSYHKSFMQCMESYQLASSVELGPLDNAYGNMDFIFANKCIRNKAYNLIYDKIKNSVFQFRTEAFHFNLLKDGNGNFLVCATKTSELDNKFFETKEESTQDYTITRTYQGIFDDIDESLEKFRCKIYRTKYEPLKREPVSGKMTKKK